MRIQTHAILKHIYKVIYILQPNHKYPIEKPLLALCTQEQLHLWDEYMHVFGEERGCRGTELL